MDARRDTPLEGVRFFVPGRVGFGGRFGRSDEYETPVGGGDSVNALARALETTSLDKPQNLNRALNEELGRLEWYTEAWFAYSNVDRDCFFYEHEPNRITTRDFAAFFHQTADEWEPKLDPKFTPHFHRKIADNADRILTILWLKGTIQSDELFCEVVGARAGFYAKNYHGRRSLLMHAHESGLIVLQNTNIRKVRESTFEPWMETLEEFVKCADGDSGTNYTFALTQEHTATDMYPREFTLAEFPDSVETLRFLYTQNLVRVKPPDVHTNLITSYFRRRAAPQPPAF